MCKSGEGFRCWLDFDDFTEQSRMLGAPHELGVLAAAAAGSESARLVLSSLRGLHPCFLPMVGFLAGESEYVPELGSVPGFFALEARLLDRLVRTGAQGADVRRERSVPDASRTLVIGKDETWFAYEGREVSLRKTHTLRRVFGGLLAARAKGAALGVDAVFSVGWPGERVAASSATNRVYVSANFSCLEVGACKAQPALDRRDDADLARIIAGRRRRTTRGLVFERDPGPHVAPG